MSKIAFLGLGAMGSRMARRLIDAGHHVVVWNRTAEKATPLVDAGASTASTPREAVEGAELVITMLADPAALAAVTEGPDGLVDAVDPRAAVVEMSTVGPDAIHRLRSILPSSVGLVDAPVLGSLSEVEAGTLRVFVGGPHSLYQRLAPLLSALGETQHVGPLGSGAAAKLVANSTLVGVLGVLGEALALADALGLSRENTFEVLATTPLAAQAERRQAAVRSGDYPVRFALSLALKDADLVTRAGSRAGADLRLAAAARSWYADAVDASWGERDYSSILAFIDATARRATDGADPVG